MTNLLITVTAYCWCADCNTKANQRTASGVWPRVGVTVAAPRSIPFGTRVNIPGRGWLTVQDRLAKRYDNRIDVFVRTHEEAKRFGKRTMRVWVKEK